METNQIFKVTTVAIGLVIGCFATRATSVTLTIDGKGEVHKVSPYIYGKNNSTSDDSSKATTEAEWTQIIESGVTFLRENSGNNSTKYNYSRHLSSHPDWYNNVEPHDWDYELQSIQERLPNVQAMYGFQLLGYVASTEENNFDDWGWYIDHNKQWLNRAQNVAGIGGVANPDNGKTALVEGDPNSYLMPWPADSTVGILDHWFGETGLGFDRSKVLYWAMDNEPEIWSGTHDDVQKEPVSADEFIDKYIAVAKAAKNKWPDIKLVGPITCNEWQWYAGSDYGVTVGEEFYPWIEYFIKRIGEEEARCGVKLLDVFAIHYYPSKLKDAEVIQCHRLFFDETYNYPQANGIKMITGKWNNNNTKEYVFKRCQEWMMKYMGETRGFGMTECGIESSDANICSIWYGSTIGEFMKEKVEIFSPWTWKNGMWETLHLFARYNQPYYLSSQSSNDSLVSIHTTINETKDSLTVLLINRSISEATEIEINLSNFELRDGDYMTLELSDLPDEETFVSHTDNALKTKATSFNNRTAKLSLPPLSTTTILLNAGKGTNISPERAISEVKVFPTSTQNRLHLSGLGNGGTIQIISMEGKSLITQECTQDIATLNIEQLPNGYYLCAITLSNITKTIPIIKY